jgi:hypothetical protein
MIAATPSYPSPGSRGARTVGAARPLRGARGHRFDVARERLTQAVAMAQSARGLVIELTKEAGRPPLHILADGRRSADADCRPRRRRFVVAAFLVGDAADGDPRNNFLRAASVRSRGFPKTNPEGLNLNP